MTGRASKCENRTGRSVELMKIGTQDLQKKDLEDMRTRTQRQRHVYRRRWTNQRRYRARREPARDAHRGSNATAMTRRLLLICTCNVSTAVQTRRIRVLRCFFRTELRLPTGGKRHLRVDQTVRVVFDDLLGEPWVGEWLSRWEVPLTVGPTGN